MQAWAGGSERCSETPCRISGNFRTKLATGGPSACALWGFRMASKCSQRQCFLLSSLSTQDVLQSQHCALLTTARLLIFLGRERAEMIFEALANHKRICELWREK